MSVSRLTHITQIGVEQMGDLADSLNNPEILRLENLDTDLRPPQRALEFTKRAVDDDSANSYLPLGGSKEYRMIGWRVGWVVGPADIVADVARVSITNVVCQTGIAMGAVATAIGDPNDGIQSCVGEWQHRRDVLLDELRDFVAIPPHGGWSLLLDVSPLGLDGVTASTRLLELGKIAASPMLHWGSARSRKYVRFVFANEPVHRLRGVGKCVTQALI